MRRILKLHRPLKEPITPVDIDEDGLITVEIDNREYYVSLDKVERIEF